ncbi:MAG: hypothetical protein LBL17_01440 [Coxiellaceae bacterium]|jgi:FimV-like protein|nr:hypothetical protein [Coxiellaceae bacterium]
MRVLVISLFILILFFNSIVYGETEPISPETVTSVSVTTPVVENSVLLTAQELTSRLISLEAQIAEMNERISAIESNKLEQQDNKDFLSAILQFFKQYKQYMDAILTGGVAIVILFLLVHVIASRSRKSGIVKYPEESNYNLLEDQGGIVAKLNLARAYVEMGHESKAESMLYEVLSQGNEAEQDEAKMLLEKIKNAG